MLGFERKTLSKAYCQRTPILIPASIKRAYSHVSCKSRIIGSSSSRELDGIEGCTLLLTGIQHE